METLLGVLLVLFGTYWLIAALLYLFARVARWYWRYRAVHGTRPRLISWPLRIVCWPFSRSEKLINESMDYQIEAYRNE